MPDHVGELFRGGASGRHNLRRGGDGGGGTAAEPHLPSYNTLTDQLVPLTKGVEWDRSAGGGGASANLNRRSPRRQQGSSATPSKVASKVTSPNERTAEVAAHATSRERYEFVHHNQGKDHRVLHASQVF